MLGTGLKLRALILCESADITNFLTISCGKEEGGSTNLATEAPQRWHVARFGTNEVTTTVVVTFAGKEIRFCPLIPFPIPLLPNFIS